MERESLEQLWKPFRYELTRDFVALAELVRRVRRAHPELDDLEVRAATLELLRYALSHDEAEAGNFAPDKRALVPWEGTADDVLRRADVEWGLLGREPGVGEVLWLQSPRWP